MATPIEDTTSQLQAGTSTAPNDSSNSNNTNSNANKSADAIVADLDFDKQLRHNLIVFIPLLLLSLLVTGAGIGLSSKAILDILASANEDEKVYREIKDGSVPKTNFFLIGSCLSGFGIFMIMVVTVMYLDRRERIVNRRKIIEEEQRLQKLKAKPKNIFDVLLTAARENKAAQGGN